MSTIIEILRFARKRKGVTYAQLSERTSVHKANLINIFNNKANPTLATVQKIMDALDVRLIEDKDYSFRGDLESDYQQKKSG